MKTLLKRILCLLAVAGLIISGVGTFYGHAENEEEEDCSITVTNYFTGESLYTGGDLQKAMDAAEHGSIVHIGTFVPLDTNIYVDTEVMLIGYGFISPYLGGNVKLLLTGDGAIFCTEEISPFHISAKNRDYSKVKVAEETGDNGIHGFIYYLVTETPVLKEETFSYDIGKMDDLYGIQHDTEAGVLYLDGLYAGMPTEDLAAVFTMESEGADGVDVTFENAVKVDGVYCVATGTKLVITADNVDYDGVVSVEYQLVVLGDVNGNGRVDSADASLTLRHANEVSLLTDLALLAADADRDGAVTAADADTLCKKCVRGGYKSPLL